MTLTNVQASFRDTLLKAGFELVPSGKPYQLTEDELLDALSGMSASLAGSEPYSERVLAAHPQLRVIARVGVGYDAVDLPAATARAIAVTITPNTNQGSVAEHTFTLMLALVKNLIPQHQGTCQGTWPRRTNIPLRGQTLGLAGLGRIGKAVALRALAFEMNVIAYDPFPDQAFSRAHGIRLVSFETLLSESDVVSLHMPATAESKYLINRTTLALMKPTAWLINTSRGSVVSEADLYEALKSRRLAGAGLDVFEEEPPAKSPLFELDNVVVTPHAAGMDFRSRDDMAQSAAEAIVDLSQGRWPSEKVVNPEIRERFRW
jgi:phosphoglycerate dehydrogenase-like enzyme